MAPAGRWGGRIRWVPVLLPVLGSAALALVPPYFGADQASPGLRHVSMGHHPRWVPPSAEEACLALVERAGSAGWATDLTCLPAAPRRPGLIVRVNRVRLAGELAAVVLAGLACHAAAERLRRV